MKKLKPVLKYFGIFLASLLCLVLTLFYIPFPENYLAEKAGDHADFYFEDEEKWIKDRNFFEVLYYKWWEFKIRKELVHNLHERYEKQSKLPLIHFVTREVQYSSIHQHQQDFPVITGSATSNLIRGFGFCDQINSSIALYLHEKLEEADLYTINSGSNGHTLVKTVSDNGTVWADAYGCNNVFGFPDELTEKGKKYISLYEISESPVFSEKCYKESLFFNSFSFSYTLKKGFDRIKNLFVSKTLNPDQPVTFFRNDSLIQKEIFLKHSALLAAIQNDSKETKRAYLTARVYHLTGKYDKALFYYQVVKAKTIHGLLGKLSDTFIKRIKGEEILCSE